MTDFNLCLNLPDTLAYEAEKYGLLNSQVIESLLRDELRRCRVSNLFVAMDRLASINDPSLTEAEIEAEINAVREEKYIAGACRS